MALSLLFSLNNVDRTYVILFVFLITAEMSSSSPQFSKHERKCRKSEGHAFGAFSYIKQMFPAVLMQIWFLGNYDPIMLKFC